MVTTPSGIVVAAVGGITPVTSVSPPGISFGIGSRGRSSFGSSFSISRSLANQMVTTPCWIVVAAVRISPVTSISPPGISLGIGSRGRCSFRGSFSISRSLANVVWVSAKFSCKVLRILQFIKYERMKYSLYCNRVLLRLDSNPISVAYESSVVTIWTPQDNPIWYPINGLKKFG